MVKNLASSCFITKKFPPKTFVLLYKSELQNVFRVKKTLEGIFKCLGGWNWTYTLIPFVLTLQSDGNDDRLIITVFQGQQMNEDLI